MGICPASASFRDALLLDKERSSGRRSLKPRGRPGEEKKDKGKGLSPAGIQVDSKHPVAGRKFGVRTWTIKGKSTDKKLVNILSYGGHIRTKRDFTEVDFESNRPLNYRFNNNSCIICLNSIN